MPMIIGAHNNDTHTRIFVNSLEGRAVVDFFDIPDKIYSTWFKLVYQFKSTFGHMENHSEYMRSFNNISYETGQLL